MTSLTRLLTWLSMVDVDLKPDACEAMCVAAVNVLDLTHNVVSPADYFQIPRHGATCADLLRALANEPHSGRIKGSVIEDESIELKKYWAIVDAVQNQLCINVGKETPPPPHLDTFNAVFGYVLESEIALKAHEGMEAQEPAKHSELINARNAAREFAETKIRKSCEKYVKK